MSVFDATKKKRRSSNISLVKADDAVLNEHQETSPALNVSIHNAYVMGPAFGEKFPVAFIRHMVRQTLNKLLKGN